MKTTHLLVGHHQNLKLLDIVDQELLEATGQHVLGLLVATITNVGHQHLTLEPPADPVVNTSGLTPVSLFKVKTRIISKQPYKHKQSLPRWTRDLTAILTYLSDWWRINFLVRFLTILGFVRGLRAAMVTEHKNIKHFYGEFVQHNTIAC